MTVICLSDQIKQIPIADVVRRYGFTPNRGGFIACPFHEDRTPSLKLYEENNTWYCFSCCRHGTAIDFVMDLYDLPFKEAVNKLAGDFGISAPEKDPLSVRKEIREREEKKAEEQETEDKWRFLYDALWDRYDTLYSIITTRGKLLTGAEYAEMEWLGYFLETYPLGVKLTTDRKKKILDREWDVHLPLLEEYAGKVADQHEKSVRSGAMDGKDEAETSGAPVQDGPEKQTEYVFPEGGQGAGDHASVSDVPEMLEKIESWLKENPADERIGRQCL